MLLLQYQCLAVVGFVLTTNTVTKKPTADSFLFVSFLGYYYFCILCCCCCILLLLDFLARPGRLLAVGLVVVVVTRGGCTTCAASSTIRSSCSTFSSWQGCCWRASLISPLSQPRLCSHFFLLLR